MIDKEKGYGRLFNSEKDAQKWQNKYGISGTIVEYLFLKKEENDGRSKLEG